MTKRNELIMISLLMRPVELIKKRFVGVHELRVNLTKLLSKLDKNSEVIVTKQGKPTAILMGLKSYKELTDKLARLGVRKISYQKGPDKS